MEFPLKLYVNDKNFSDASCTLERYLKFLLKEIAESYPMEKWPHGLRLLYQSHPQAENRDPPSKEARYRNVSHALAWQGTGARVMLHAFDQEWFEEVCNLGPNKIPSLDKFFWDKLETLDPKELK